MDDSIKPNETKEVTEQPQVDLDNMIKVSELRFRAGLIKCGNLIKNLSNRGVKRALFAATTLNTLKDEKFKFQSKDEAIFAGNFAQVLDLRTTIQALRLRQQELEGEKKDGEDKKTET